MTKAAGTTGNKDLDPLLPELLAALKEPTKVPETIHVLASTTFVQTVQRGALALVSPLLQRGYNERKDIIKRQCSVITSNMSKLVEAPEEASPFLPALLPAVGKATEEVADPEARGVCEKAYEQLKRIDEAAKAAKPRATDPVSIKGFLKEKFGDLNETVLSHAAASSTVCWAATTPARRRSCAPSPTSRLRASPTRRRSSASSSRLTFLASCRICRALSTFSSTLASRRWAPPVSRSR